MANYFTNFSLIVPLPSEIAQNYAVALAEQARSINEGDEAPADFPASLLDVVEDWQLEAQADYPSESWGLWLHSENGGIDAVCAFIQYLLQRFDPLGHVTLQWSNDCSKPRVDAYGGGAALVTARRIKSMNTANWLHRQVARLPAQKPAHPLG